MLALADKGWRPAMADDPHLLAGLNVARGEVVHPVVARALGYPVLEPGEWLARS